MIYIVSHYYEPVNNPPAKRMALLAEVLIERYGSENVCVVTGRPNHPYGKLPPEYKWRIYKKRMGARGEIIHSLYELPSPNKGFFRKTLGYLSFAFSVFFFFLFRKMKPGDWVVVTSPPVFTGYSIYSLSKLKRNFRYIADVRDLWPQTVAGMGFLKESSWLFRRFKRRSDKLYLRAKKRVAVTDGIAEYLTGLAGEDGLSLIYNPVDMELFCPGTPGEIKLFREQFPEYYGDGEKAVFIFSGSLSVYMGLEYLIRSLVKVREQTQDFLFMIIGYGEEEEKLKESVKQAGLETHVRFLPLMKRAELVRYIQAADYGYSSTIKRDIFKMVVPTKLGEYFACNKFVMCVHEGAFMEQIEREKVGVVAVPEDIEGQAQVITELIGNKSKYVKGKRPRQFAEKKFADGLFKQSYLSLFD